jgi:broad specificity phosphatase PhoE
MQWLAWFRIKAFLGWWGRDGNMHRFLHRADRAAETLVNMAQEHGNVVLMGHGALNHFIGKSLRNKDWNVSRNGGMENWSYVQMDFLI